MFFEHRQYTIKDGKIARWVELMEKEIIPFQASKGMVIVGSWTVEGEPDLYVWMRRFDSEAERVQQYKDVYETEHWQKVIKPRIDEMLNREAMRITRLVPTTKSPIR